MSKPRIRVKAVCVVVSAPSAASSPDVQGAPAALPSPAAGSCSFEYPEIPEFLRRSHATTFRVAADSAIHESSPIPASVFSVNGSGHAKPWEGNENIPNSVGSASGCGYVS